MVICHPHFLGRLLGSCELRVGTIRFIIHPEILLRMKGALLLTLLGPLGLSWELASLKVVVLKLFHAKDCWRRLLGPAFRHSDPLGLGSENLHPNEFPGDTDAAGCWTMHFEKPDVEHKG